MRVRRLSLIFEGVTDAAYGLNQLVVETVIDLPAQVADVDVDRLESPRKSLPHTPLKSSSRVCTLLRCSKRYSSSAYSLA